MAIIDRRKGYNPVTILVYDRKKKLRFEETSLIALDKQAGKIVAVGNDVKPLIYDLNNNLVILSPIKNGAIADYTLACKMLQEMLKKASLAKPVIKHSVAVSVADDMTEVERKALTDAIYQGAGARKVLLMEQSIAEMDQTLPSVYRILVKIMPDELAEQAQGDSESWNEICKGKIPPDNYQLTSYCKQDSDTIITLSGQSNCVKMTFNQVLIMRITANSVFPEDSLSEIELKKYREKKFDNVVYQIDNGQLSGWLSARGRTYSFTSKHYIIVGEKETIEIIAGKEPDISVG